MSNMIFIRLRHLVVYTLFFLISMPLSAQQEDDSTKTPLYKSINFNYIFGAQLYNDNFLYNPGYSMDLTIGKAVDNNLGLGMGLAYTDFSDKVFIPIYFEVLGKKNNKINTPFIKFQGGYSYGLDRSTNNMVNYDFNGGFYFSAGFGRMIMVKDKYEILFHCSYSHQFAEIQYQVFGETDYSETLNYDMIKISIGILFE